MATLKNNRIRTGTVLFFFFLFGVFFVVKAMDKKTEVVAEPTKTLATTTYFYNGPSSNLATNIMDHTKWNTSQNSSFECDPEAETVPCSLEVPEDKDIDQYLQELGDLSGVQAATPTRRSDAE
ncbi:hypothetical protein [Sphingobacterium hotanense]|uniref:hypothetical protein n=1 Tax=Sphingobacterium hotanense TaxID=649196 RepID=UPI0021A2810E|nr:hypothetical protein [Sphingobacterium hotanense]MCT1526211.1 hypothetical protein [Sphingobacterium hotanense]